jgi:D-3-phosphoglycerate dehydrogenase
VTQVPLDKLVATSDVLVLACPLTDETRGLMGMHELAALRHGAVLINVARGPVVDAAALLTQLRTGRISAALDVFDTQPLPLTDPLFDLDNVILTPHFAGITVESMKRMGDGAADEVQRILNGQMPLNFCNPEVEARYRARFA